MPSEARILPQLTALLGRLDAEITMARVLLRRTLIAELQWQKQRAVYEAELEAGLPSPRCCDHFPLESVDQEDSPSGKKVKRVRTRVGYVERVLSLMRLVGKLEVQRATIAKIREESSVDQIARDLRATMRGMAAMTPGLFDPSDLELGENNHENRRRTGSSQEDDAVTQREARRAAAEG